MPPSQNRSPRSFTEAAIELGLCDERKVRDALLVKQKLAEMDVHRSLEDILIERGYISEEGIKQVQRALKGDNQLAGFELVEKVGAGAMGAVFRARQVSLDRIVAVKVLPRHLAEDSSFVKRFLREARNVAKLNHPNIIQGIDVGEDRGYYYFAMEYIDGTDVRSMIEETGVMPEKDALRTLLGAARGLGHAWRNDILHRDIKPANIMITSDNTVKLCDLGLATALGKGADASASNIGKAVGTPYYISPEQAKGEREIDTRSDVYSLGATLYHMLTGHPPFEGYPAAVVLAKHLKDKVEPIGSIRPDVSRNTTLFLAKMLAKDRDRRHQAPTEVIEDIEDLLAGKPPRHSVRFRQESTLSVPFLVVRQTGRHATVVARRVKVRQAQKSGAIALFFLMVLFMAFATLIVWKVFKENVIGPRLPRTPPPSSTPVPIPGSTPVPRDGAEHSRSVKTPSAIPGTATQAALDANGGLMKALVEINNDLHDGRISPADARIHLLAFIERNPKHGLDKQVQAIAAEIERLQRERHAALASASKGINSLIAADNLAQAARTFDALSRSGFSSVDLGPIREALIEVFDKALKGVESDVRKALYTEDTAGARKALAEWTRENGMAAERFPGFTRRTRDLETTIREKEHEVLSRLAEAIGEVRSILRSGRALNPADLPPDLPKAHRDALMRESQRAMAFIDKVARKVSEIGQAKVPYHNVNIFGKTSYAGPGRIKIRTRRGMEVGVSILEMPSNMVMGWAMLAKIADNSEKMRFIIFAGSEELPEGLGIEDKEDAADTGSSVLYTKSNALDTESSALDLKLLLKAVKAEREAVPARREASPARREDIVPDIVPRPLP